MTLDGKSFAAEILGDLAPKIAAFGRPISLAVILIKGDEASEIYVRNKALACEQIKMRSQVHKFAANACQSEISALIKQLNDDDAIDGILVQLPLPKQINSLEIISQIRADKDVDGFCASNLGALLGRDESALIACTPLGIIRLLERYGIALRGANCCVVSDSIIVGRPLAALLLNRGASVDVVHEHTADLAAHTARADVLISATGKANLIDESMIKPGAVLVDVGVAMHGANGDISLAAKQLASAYTPVPGGVGPMTVAMLLENTYYAALRRENARKK